MEEKPKPGIGVAAVVFKDGKILLGEDLTKGGESIFGVPGGHWESGETLSDAIKREVLEESGIEIQNITLISVYDFFRKDKNKSYVTIGFKAEHESGTLKDESKDTRKNWGWFELDKLPMRIFPPDKILIERFQSGIVWKEK